MLFANVFFSFSIFAPLREIFIPLAKTQGRKGRKICYRIYKKLH